MADIEVRVAGKGVVKGDEVRSDPSTEAGCGLCGASSELVAALTAELYACRDCLRARLDASSVASWHFRQTGGGLPWGQIAG